VTASLIASLAFAALAASGSSAGPVPGRVLLLPTEREDQSGLLRLFLADAVAAEPGKAPFPGMPEWKAVTPGEDGLVEGAGGGWILWEFEEPADRIAILEATGSISTMANGDLRAGDFYANNPVLSPVRLKAGTNRIVIQAGRTAVIPRIASPQAPRFLTAHDATVPTPVAGSLETGWLGINVANATESGTRTMAVRARWQADNAPSVESPVGPLLPLALRKAAVRIPAAAGLDPGTHTLLLELLDGDAVVHELKLPVTIVAAGAPFVHTRISPIDGSVQEMYISPATGDHAHAGLALALHGAGVTARGHGLSYARKTFAHIVCPTNRRPFGFDWEDWGRLDALEALEEAGRILDYDPSRVWLTGHSMGGHGTWHLGVHYPDRFAAVAPSAGWISFSTYGQGRSGKEAREGLDFRFRAARPSDTLALQRNLATLGVYILHGDADDNVPVTEARRMKAALAPWHPHLLYHEQPGAGHWWGGRGETIPGVDCTDWPPMWDLFCQRAIPARGALRDLAFVTTNPAVSDRSHWLRIVQLEHTGIPGEASFRQSPEASRIDGHTTGVVTLALDLPHFRPGAPVTLRIDGEEIVADRPDSGELFLSRRGGTWTTAAAPPAGQKNPRRYGPLKDGLRHNLLLVYGTQGTDEEDRWYAMRARLDAEAWAYRANGAFDVVADTEFDAAATRDRSVLLYGNADTNSAWATLLADSPIQARRGRIEMAHGFAAEGEDLVALFIRPRPGSDVASVVAVADSGLAGARFSLHLPMMQSGVGIPDYLVLRAGEAPGSGAQQLATGFFDLDWNLAPEDEKAHWEE
jgi:pimeloyl-ACP methyl ester carboxylesterase